VTRCSFEADGIEKGLNRSLRLWFGGRSDALLQEKRYPRGRVLFI